MPTYCQIRVMIGSAISGKMSLGVRAMATMPSRTIASAATTKVYGRASARRTIHITYPPGLFQFVMVYDGFIAATGLACYNDASGENYWREGRTPSRRHVTSVALQCKRPTSHLEPRTLRVSLTPVPSPPGAF